MSRLQNIINKGAINKSVEELELERIIDLAIEPDPSEQEIELLSKKTILKGKDFDFFPEQAKAIIQYRKYGGAFCPIPVGFGKTLTMLVIANEAYNRGITKTIIFVPPATFSQLVKRDIPWARKRVALNIAFWPIGNMPQTRRSKLASSGRAGCYILPYSYLQTRDARDLLKNINPGLIICDECHYLKNKKTARTKRLLSYIKKEKPAGVCLSGTITNKSIKDYHHLISWCLKDKSPLPREYMTTVLWAAAIDADADPQPTSQPLMRLVSWARSTFPDEDIPPSLAGTRRAYKCRLVTCPGVVSGTGEQLGISLHVNNEPSQYEKSQELKDLIEKVEVDYVTPNGDNIDHAIHLNKWLVELHAGFWHKLVFPTGEEFAERKGIPLRMANRLVESAKLHHEVHNDFTKILRAWLNNTNRPNLDTPWLVTQDMHRNKAKNVGRDLYDAWRQAKDLEVKGMPDRDSTPILVDEFKIKAAVDWVKGNKRDHGLIIWYHHNALGEWTAAALRKAGYDVLLCKAGDQRILDKSSSKQVTVASLAAHGTGKNLQHYKAPYYLQWPRGAVMAEQSIGRVHRRGQEEDEIFVTTSLTSQFDRLLYASCLNDALYISQTSGDVQKIIYCNYNPMPLVMPSGFLRERGFQNQILSAKQQKELEERFKND
jgi:hypothetical protein